MKILIIEDDYDTAQTLKDLLKKDYIVEIALSGREARDLIFSTSYQFIICDIVLPDASGIDICHEIRNHHIQTPILMLTGQADPEKITQALDCGADDYLTKPFNEDVLKARIRAILRRSPKTLSSNVILAGDLSIDLQSRIVKRGQKNITLRRKELELLEYLARNQGRVLSKEAIIDHLWKSSAALRPNTIEVHIKYLRDQIDRPFTKKMIKTVYGVGYRLDA